MLAFFVQLLSAFCIFAQFIYCAVHEFNSNLGLRWHWARVKIKDRVSVALAGVDLVIRDAWPLKSQVCIPAISQLNTRACVLQQSIHSSLYRSPTGAWRW